MTRESLPWGCVWLRGPSRLEVFPSLVKEESQNEYS